VVRLKSLLRSDFASLAAEAEGLSWGENSVGISAAGTSYVVKINATRWTQPNGWAAKPSDQAPVPAV
jgi:hypothetical protein